MDKLDARTNKMTRGILQLKDRQLIIKDLFELMGKSHGDNREGLQEIILFVMEQEHDWVNITKFAREWKKNEWAYGLLGRMKVRVNEDGKVSGKEDLWAELERLYEKFWLKVSPKKEVRQYQQSQQVNETKSTSEPPSQPNNPRIDKLFNHGKRASDVFEVSNQVRKIKFGRPSLPATGHQEEAKQESSQPQAPVYENPMKDSRRKTIAVSPLKVPIDKKPIRVKESSKSPIRPDDSFSFSVAKQKQRPDPASEFKSVINETFQDFQSHSKPIDRKLFESKAPENEAQKFKNTEPVFNTSFELPQQRFELPKRKISLKKQPRQDTLFSKQQETLIDFSVKPVNYYERVLKQMNISAFKELDNALEDLVRQK